MIECRGRARAAYRDDSMEFLGETPWRGNCPLSGGMTNPEGILRARLLPCQKSFLFRASELSRAREGRRSESSGASPPPRRRDTRDASRAGKRAGEKDGGDEIDKKRDIVNALLTVPLALSGKQLGRKARKEERRSRTLRALSKMHSNTPIESRACSPVT